MNDSMKESARPGGREDGGEREKERGEKASVQFVHFLPFSPSCVSKGSFSLTLTLLCVPPPPLLTVHTPPPS